jgi:hypothetical protein
MTSSDPARTSTGICWIVAGLGLFLLARPFDGFWAGLLTGACVASMVIGVAIVSSAWRRNGGWLPTRDTDQGDWLPSRDEDRLR